MAGEIQCAYITGKTLYALVRNSVGEVWKTTTTSFVTYATADLADYTISLTEQGTASGYYTGTFPSAASGTYAVAVYEQAGGSAAEGDPCIATGNIEWDGSAIVYLDSRLQPYTAGNKIYVDGSGRVDLGQWIGFAPAALSGSEVQVSVKRWNGTVVPTPNTAGYPLVDVAKVNNVSTSSVTTINANVGTTQPVNFTGTAGSALVQSDMVDVAGAVAQASNGYVLTPDVLAVTTIATLASQTSFTLAAGAADDGAYKGCVAVVQHTATGVQKAVGVVSAYTGSTKTVTLLNDPGVFTMAVGDVITILADRSLKATTDNRTLDVSTGGEAGVDWANVGGQSTSVNLSATTISTSQVVASVTGAVGSVTSGVTVTTNNDKTGYALSSSGLDLVTAWTANITGDITGNLSGSVGSVSGAVGSVTGNVGGNVTGSVGSLATQAKADVNAEVDAALADINLDHLLKLAVDTDFATTVHLNSVVGQLADDGTTATFDRTTDSLEAVRDRGDAAWITATGFSTHSAADVWAVATRTLTAGTNIVLAKGTGVTGFNDLSAAQVNAEVDAALADYDGPTHAELVSEIDDVQSDIAALNNITAADVWAVGSRTLTAFAFSVTVGTNNDKTGYSLTQAFPANFDVLSIDASGRVKIQSGIVSNQALNNFAFTMYDSADHVTPKTGLTVTAERSIDGAGFAACANAVAEIGSGVYRIDFAASDLNGAVIVFKFTAGGADTTEITVVPSS